MHRLTLLINSAPVQFEAKASRADAIARFAIWLQAIPPTQWQVAANLGPSAHSYLRAGQHNWTVNTFLSPDDPGARGRFETPQDALHAFGDILRRDGDHWTAPVVEEQTRITFILPSVAAPWPRGEPDPEQARAGVVWLLDWMREHREQTLELRATRQAQATALFHLNRGELREAREALAALTLTPGEFDIAALPPPVREALEDLSRASIRAGEEQLRRHVDALITLVGLGWTPEQIAAELEETAQSEPAAAA